MSLTSFYRLYCGWWTYFTPWSSVSNVYFEQIITVGVFFFPWKRRGNIYYCDEKTQLNNEYNRPHFGETNKAQFFRNREELENTHPIDFFSEKSCPTHIKCQFAFSDFQGLKLWEN